MGEVERHFLSHALGRAPAGGADEETEALVAVEVPAPVGRRARKGKHARELLAPRKRRLLDAYDPVRLALAGVEEAGPDLAAACSLRELNCLEKLACLRPEAEQRPDPGDTDHIAGIRADRRP